MKFCSVCGVALAQPIEPAGQPEQNSSGFAYNPPQLPKMTKSKPNKFVLGLIALAVFVAWASNGEDSSTSETSSSASPSEPITQQETPDQSVFVSYYPLTAEFETKLNEIADNAIAGDLEATVAGCNDLKDLSERGLALSPTGNSDFDQAWVNAMDAGVKSAESCIAGDFDTATTYLAEMSENIVTATSYIE
jgi:hypothetical protein